MEADLPPGAGVLAVDLQPVFIDSIQERDRVLRRCQFVLGCATLLRLPVFFTEQVPSKLGTTEASLVALAPEAPRFAKSAFSALAEPGVEDQLRGEGIEHLILCGLETSICVYLTAIQALQAGFHVTVLVDAVGARRSQDVPPCLDALARAGAYLLPSETVFYSLVGSAEHPAFKAYTKLVKTYA